MSCLVLIALESFRNSVADVNNYCLKFVIIFQTTIHTFLKKKYFCYCLTVHNLLDYDIHLNIVCTEYSRKTFLYFNGFIIIILLATG